MSSTCTSDTTDKKYIIQNTLPKWKTGDLYTHEIRTKILEIERNSQKSNT